jgi:hypothetical protein
MHRYIIRDKKTGKYLRRTKSYGIRSDWVDIDNATLITTGSAASQIATYFCPDGERYRHYRYRDHLPVEVIKVQILLIPEGTQPFIK